MSRSKIIKIDGKKIKLFFSTWAFMHMSERISGDITLIRVKYVLINLPC